LSTLPNDDEAGNIADAMAPVPHAAQGQVRSSHGYGHYAHITIPAAVFVVLAGVTLWLWRMQVGHELRDVRDDTALMAPVAAERFELIVTDEMRPLGRLARELGSGTITTAQRFAESASSVQQAVGSLKTVAWVEVSGNVVAVSPKEHEDELPPDRSPYDAAYWGEALTSSIRPHRHNVVIAGQWHGAPAQWVCMPFRGGENISVNGQRPAGFLLARVNFGDRAADSFGRESWLSVHMTVRDARGTVVYESPPEGAEPARNAGVPRSLDGYAAEHVFPVLGSPWSVRLRPTAAFVLARHGHADQLVLAGGLTAAVLATALCAQAQLHRRRERRRTDVHLAALEALAKVLASISTAPPAPADVLARLARAAARLMNMSMSSVSLYDAEQRTMRVVFRDALPNPEDRDVYAVEETPCSADCMRTRRPVAFEDTEAPGSPFPTGHMQRYGVRSLILVPLIVADRAVGVLMLCHGTVRRYTATDARLVELWMTQASAILSNRKLYEDMTAAIENERQLQNQRAKLYEVNARIQYAPTLRDALRLVAELAPQALEVNACVVCLAHPARGHIHVAAITPGQATEDLLEDVVAECATCAGVIEGGGVKRVADLRDHPVRGFPHMGSALFVPLSSGGATLGLLVLLRIARGPFTAEQVRVAELFAARAAAAIERNRLLDETRRQADTNAVLLRELNHRVGNNFAGIIGLLKVAARGLPTTSRAALDRAVERVHLMSRAHELFSGGVRSVPLADLVQTTLASVSSLGEAAARADVRVDLHDPDVRLFSTRAITLAMVLHELAYNAMEHALGDAGGELTVRSRGLGPARIAIDVVDRAAIPVRAVDDEGGTDASGNVNVHRTAHAGIGLELVRSLVARELGGQFTLTRSDGGTTATVEFAVEQPLELEQPQEVECRP